MPPITSIHRRKTSIQAPQGAKPSAWGLIQPIIGWMSNVALLVTMGYGISDFLIRFRQSSANDKAAELKLLKEEKKMEKAQEQEWAKIARTYPELYFRKLVLTKRTKRERRAALTVLYVENPEWVQNNLALFEETAFEDL
jgi:hypothetical protein